MDISDCKSITNNKKICVEENKRKFCLINAKKRSVNKINLDRCGCFQRKKKCDYVFEINCLGLVIYVELKGCNVAEAVNQVNHTIVAFETMHINRSKFGYVISRCVPRFQSAQQNLKKKFFRDHPTAKLIIKNDIFEHSI